MHRADIIPKNLRKLAIGSSTRGEHDPDEEWLPLKIVAIRWGCSPGRIQKIAALADIEPQMSGRTRLYPLRRIRRAVQMYGTKGPIKKNENSRRAQ